MNNDPGQAAAWTREWHARRRKRRVSSKMGLRLPRLYGLMFWFM